MKCAWEIAGSIPQGPFCRSPVPDVNDDVKHQLKCGKHMVVSINGGTPKMYALQGNILYKWMIGGYPYFRKPPSAVNLHTNPNHTCYTMIHYVFFFRSQLGELVICI